MSNNCVNVALYGSLARFGNGRYVAQLDVALQPGTTITELLTKLNIPEEEKGFLFINGILSDMPGLTASGQEVLIDGDHVGIFSKDYMWPYQYRDGIVMSKALKETLRERGGMHHAYRPMSDASED